MPRIMRKTVKEKFKVYGNVFDHFTVRTIIHLSSKLGFDAYSLTPLFIGKEANVFLCDREGAGDESIVLKIYRLETCDFNRMYDYIKSDARFTRIKKSKRHIIFTWVQREYRNLLKAREAGVSVPTPMTFLYNILVLEFIGNEDYLAPMLKDKKPKNPKDFFNKIIYNMRKLYKAGLVHADLSGFNILNYNDIPIFIDFSQTTSLEDSRAQEYLERDIRNICIFFRKIGLDANEKKMKEKIVK